MGAKAQHGSYICLNNLFLKASTVVALTCFASSMSIQGGGTFVKTYLSMLRAQYMNGHFNGYKVTRFAQITNDARWVVAIVTHSVHSNARVLSCVYINKR